MHLNVSCISAAAAALSSLASTLYSEKIPRSSSLSATLNERTDVAPGIELRILPLGASITYGVGSSDGNGYRLALAENLSGTKLKYVGSVRSGNMDDNRNEGHPRSTITDIEGFARNSIGYQPNVILLHVGTNDFDTARPKESTGGAPERLGDLIDELVSGCPNATILVAQLIQAKNPLFQRRIHDFNDHVPGIVAKRADAGHHVMVADMRSVTERYLVDGIHPSDKGYKKMADIWFVGIKAAIAKGWIRSPVGPDPPKLISNTKAEKADTTRKRRCPTEPTLRPVNKGLPITDGLGHNGPAVFSSTWVAQGRVSEGRDLDAAGVHFADLDGDGRADYLWVDPKNAAVVSYLNAGHGIAQSWASVDNGLHIATGAIGRGDGVFFADLNGDLMADYIYVYKDGKVDWWRNDGPSSDPKVGWNWHGPITLQIGTNNATKENVLFADINGDGRDDFLIKDDRGGLEAWLNIGDSRNKNSTKWVPSGKIAPGYNTTNITLADIDGDGRDDYLVWDDKGGLTGFLNVRGREEGRPVWTKQNDLIWQGVNATSQWLQLADFTGDGKADVARVFENNGAVDLYVNTGSADTSVAGDGIRFADLNGDGLNDYLFIDLNGSITAYLNGGAQPNATHGWSWESQDKAEPISPAPGTNRHEIHLADIDGDGKADFLVVYDNGTVYCWLNEGANKQAGGGWLWNPQGQIASGIGPGIGVRFADMNGDGKADLLWLGKIGNMIVWLNNATKVDGKNNIQPNWVEENNGKPVALGVGAVRNDVQIVDIDGDGQADYVWVHPEDGSVSVWINQAEDKDGRWVQYKSKIAWGLGDAGANIKLVHIDANEWADYVIISPSTGEISLWISDCANLSPLPSTTPSKSLPSPSSSTHLDVVPETPRSSTLHAHPVSASAPAKTATPTHTSTSSASRRPRPPSLSLFALQAFVAFPALLAQQLRSRWFPVFPYSYNVESPAGV
ncbi:hypothetical protein MMC07_008980 [Pseudocyphellaria aurata]|nr:hypothetical protein [Pseudocyphellaria aurata]